MKMMRIFLNPDASKYIDVGAGVDFSLPQFWMLARQDGSIMSERGMIPVASIHHLLVLDIAPIQAPPFSIVPGGKPN